MEYARLVAGFGATAFVAVVIAACGGSTAAPIDAGASSSSSSSSSSGSTTSSSSGDTPASSSSSTGGVVDASTSGSSGTVTDAGAGTSDPGIVLCPPQSKCTTKGALTQYCCLDNAAGGVGLAGTCKNDLLATCNGHKIGCDEAADCPDGNVCCAEQSNSGSGGNNKVLTRCMPTCVTGAVRIQVCKSTNECENDGVCLAYDCGDRFPNLRFCEKPECK